jgi:hypothetical protein
MGRFSRDKGRRGEQQLVIFLSKLGYKAERVLNQAHTAGLYDVLAVSRDGKRYSFELKTYKEAFKSIYTYYGVYGKDEQTIGVLLAEGCVAMSTDFTKLLTGIQDIRFYAPTSAFEKRMARKLLNLNIKRGKADFLCLKDNNKPRLFLRYWS